MTRAEAAKLVAIIVTAYPNFDKFKDAQAVASTVDLWAAMFADDDARIVGLAVKKHIATNKWPPSVAELREIMLEIQRPELIAPDQAWAAVSDYMHTAGSWSGEHLESSPAARSACGGGHRVPQSLRHEPGYIRRQQARHGSRSVYAAIHRNV